MARVDRLVFADGGVGVAADSAQADVAGLALQHAGLADGGDEEEVVRGSGDAGVEGVITLVEFRVIVAVVPDQIDRPVQVLELCPRASRRTPPSSLRNRPGERYRTRAATVPRCRTVQRSQQAAPDGGVSGTP